MWCVMSVFDSDIEHDQRKRRRWVIISSSVLAALLFGYLSWLMLLQGYQVVIAPEDARQEASIRVAHGVGFTSGHTVYTFGGSVTLEASAPLYYSKQVEVSRRSPSRIDLELEPLPAQLTVTSNPALEDARWWVNDHLAGEGEQLVAELAEGTHEITFGHPYFQSYTLLVNAMKGEVINRHIQPEPVLGELSITSQPTGATVTINGTEAGQTPLALEQPGGRYEVQIKAPGYEPIYDALFIREDRPFDSRDYQLQLLGGTLRADVTPSGGVLTVNGSPIANPGRVNANEALRVEYSKAGYRTASQTVEVAPNRDVHVRFQLEPEYGEVQITANVPATITINGQTRGTAPQTIRLQTVPHDIRVSHPHYRAQTVSVLPEAGATRRTHVDLLEEFDARRRENQPLVATGMGIELLPVQLSAFTMGAPMHEAGRQRNELERPVTFSRAQIWVSSQHITEGQFARFRGQGDTNSTLPVTNISWLDAARFTNWLSEQEGLIPFYEIRGNELVGVRRESRGYRLPTEAEWEFIAKHFRRAARTTYVWGNQSVLRDNMANFADEARRNEQPQVLMGYQDDHKERAPVGSYPADRNGFYDLDGNVREWVHDRYGLIPVNAAGPLPSERDFLGPESGRGHVIKGASYLTGQMNLLRASVRYQGTEPMVDVGFRIARYH